MVKIYKNDEELYHCLEIGFKDFEASIECVKIEGNRTANLKSRQYSRRVDSFFNELIEFFSALFFAISMEDSKICTRILLAKTEMKNLESFRN